ncbi:MAG: DUF4349 domain-containing protein [Actinobacteria bacterium]|nr:DUF4349 domain-containing protein [Actinomycetota bacterium]
MHDDELSTLLASERPRPSAAFAAELDARVAARFPPRPRPARPRRWAAIVRRPVFPAAATALAVGLVALAIALADGGGPRVASTAKTADATSSAGGAAAERSARLGAATTDLRAAPATGAFMDESARAYRPQAQALAPDARVLAPQAGALAAPAPRFDSARKVERDASVELGTAPDRVDEVAQGVLGVVDRFDGIVDQSSVQTAQGGGEASFQLRIPAARLEPALAALSRLPDAHLVSRSDDTLDVNQAYVSVRRRLANATAERAGVVRTLANADTEEQTLRLRARLDALERTIAQAERSQRALDRRVDYSRVTVAVHGGAGGGAVPTGDGSFGIGDAAHDALRVLEVAAGVVVIAAAALLPVALLAVLAWPLARTLRRRRREHALDAV